MYDVSNFIDWPESYTLMIDFINSYYLNKEPESRTLKDLQSGNLNNAAIFLYAICERDLDICADMNRCTPDYWTKIFMTIEFSALVCWIFMLEGNTVYRDMAESIKKIVIDKTKWIIAKNLKASDFNKGLLHELRGDLAILFNDNILAAESYYISSMYYESLNNGLITDCLLYPETEPLFLQYDLIWNTRLHNRFIDSYDYVSNFNKRIETKLQIANCPSHNIAAAFI